MRSCLRAPPFQAPDSRRGRMDPPTFIPSYWTKCAENASLLTLADFRTRDRQTSGPQQKKEPGLPDASGGHTSLGGCRLRFVS